MTLHRLLLLRSTLHQHQKPIISPSSSIKTHFLHSLPSLFSISTPEIPRNPSPSSPNPSPSFSPNRTFAFSSAEEAAAERRRRKRRLRIEPPLHALRRDPNAPRPRPDPNAPRLPDSTSALTGARLNLHNRVQTLIRSGDLDTASSTARHAVFSNTRPTVFTCNAIIAAMFRARRFDDAVALFRYFFQQSNIVPNVVSYNFLINTHCDAGRVDSALEVYQHILAHAPFSPSHVTYRHLTKGLVDSNRISEAVDLLREMLNKGHGADSLVYNTLMSGFINLGNMEKALELFDELRERCLVYDGVLHATLMEAYFKKGMEKEAMDSFRDLLVRQFKMNAVTCNTLLEVLLKWGKLNDASQLFDQMLISHTPPNFLSMNTDSYNLMVNEYCRIKKFGDAIVVFKKTGTKPCVMDVGCYNNIIGKLCAEDEWVFEADKLFHEMPTKSVNPDTSTYGFLVDGYFREGRVDDALRCFNKMVGEAGLKAEVGFYNKVFGGLVEKGRVEDAVEVFGRMAEREVKPDSMSYEIVVIGLCKESRLDQGRNLLEEMVNNGLGVSPTLREAVLDAFGKEGRSNEVERLFEEKTGFVADSAMGGAPQAQQVAA
ncbi:glutamine-rich protein 23 [Tasmannia lanceolata]|uniref:glutamine-rich protein 23 n=1 Tax=Tasmannia lanceolata TaxID=3420 RepID=UPI004062D74D